MICQQRLSLSDMLSMLKHTTCDCIVYILYNANIYWNWWYKLYFWSLKKTIIVWVIDINPISILIVYPYNCSSSINSSDYTFLTFRCLYIRTIHVHAVVITEILLMLALNTNQSYLWEFLNVSVEANLWRLFYVATWDIKVWLKVGRGSQCARRNKLEIKISMCSLRGGGRSCARRNKLEIKISMCSLRGGGGSCARRNKLEVKISMFSLRGWWGTLC